MKGNVIQMNTLHLNSVRLNGIGKVQSVSLKGGSTEDPVFPPVEPPVEPTPTYTLSASVTNGKVSAKRNGSAVNLPFTANEGDTIIVEVTPNDGYTFEGWNDGNTDNPRTITMNADVVLSAQCVEVVQPPVGNYIQFEDKAVEAICVANWSSDGIGLTEEDAAAVTDIGLVFNKNTEIKRFNEFRYFIAVRSLRGNDSASNIAATGAFYGCSELQSIQFPPSLETINGGAFGDTTALAINVDIPSLKNIRSNAFRKSGITSITNLGTISELGAYGTINYGGEGVFYGCANLTTAEIPSSVINIPAATFYNCSALTKIVCRATTPPTLGNYAFDGSTCPIYVPDASLEAYKTAVNWSAYADRIHPLSEIEGSLVFYDKLVGDGTAFINTEYYPKGSDSFVFETGAVSSFNKFLFGVKSASICLGMLPYTIRNTYVLFGTSTATEIFTDWSVRYIRALRCENEGGAYVRKYYNITTGGNMNIANVDSYVNVVAKQPLLLFACQQNTGVAYPDGRIFRDAIYGFSIEDIDGNTIMSLKPCTFAGEAGMWDEVNGKFYGNAATSGELSVAND